MPIEKSPYLKMKTSPENFQKDFFNLRGKDIAYQLKKFNIQLPKKTSEKSKKSKEKQRKKPNIYQDKIDSYRHNLRKNNPIGYVAMTIGATTVNTVNNFARDIASGLHALAAPLINSKTHQTQRKMIEKGRGMTTFGISNDQKNAFSKEGKIKLTAGNFTHLTTESVVNMLGLLFGSGIVKEGIVKGANVATKLGGKMGTNIGKKIGTEVGEQLAYKSGLVSTAFAQQIGGSFDYAKSQGLHTSQALLYACLQSGTQAGLELFSPTTGIAKNLGILKKSKGFQKFIKEGLRREIIEENFQEVSQGLAEKVLNGFFNNSRDMKFDETFTRDDFVNTIMLTTLTTGIVGGGAKLKAMNELKKRPSFGETEQKIQSEKINIAIQNKEKTGIKKNNLNDKPQAYFQDKYGNFFNTLQNISLLTNENTIEDIEEEFNAFREKKASFSEKKLNNIENFYKEIQTETSEKNQYLVKRMEQKDIKKNIESFIKKTETNLKEIEKILNEKEKSPNSEMLNQITNKIKQTIADYEEINKTITKEAERPLTLAELQSDPEIANDIKQIQEKFPKISEDRILYFIYQLNTSAPDNSLNFTKIHKTLQTVGSLEGAKRNILFLEYAPLLNFYFPSGVKKSDIKESNEEGITLKLNGEDSEQLNISRKGDSPKIYENNKLEESLDNYRIITDIENINLKQPKIIGETQNEKINALQLLAKQEKDGYLKIIEQFALANNGQIKGEKYALKEKERTTQKIKEDRTIEEITDVLRSTIVFEDQKSLEKAYYQLENSLTIHQMKIEKVKNRLNTFLQGDVLINLSTNSGFITELKLYTTQKYNAQDGKTTLPEDTKIIVDQQEYSLDNLFTAEEVSLVQDLYHQGFADKPLHLEISYQGKEINNHQFYEIDRCVKKIETERNVSSLQKKLKEIQKINSRYNVKK